MSRTYRRSNHIKFKEGNPLKRSDIHYRCRCGWCTTDKRDAQERIVKKIMKNQLIEWDEKFQRESA